MSEKEKSDKKGSQKIMCGVTDCAHNCIDDSTCRLEAIKVNVMQDNRKAECEDGTCCKSYDYAGDLNETEITGRD
ncbi:MAG: DUF1540 domain-containing protein [Clostridia bacterium]|nr:DUF1540 domain-containing protein [Clostridia bacterium]